MQLFWHKPRICSMSKQSAKQTTVRIAAYAAIASLCACAGEHGVHFETAQTLYKNGQYPEAIQEYQHALQSDPKNGAAYAALGDIYTNLGRLPEAESAYHSAVNLNPTEQNLRALALLCYREHDYGQ